VGKPLYTISEVFELMKKRTKKRTVGYITFHSVCLGIGQYVLPFVPFMIKTEDLITDIIINGSISLMISGIIHYVVSKKGQKEIKKFYNQLIH